MTGRTLLASPWRGHKQTKQQKRRQWRKQQQHQIGKSKLHVLHERRWTRWPDQTQVRIGSCCIFGQPEVYCSVAPFLPWLCLLILVFSLSLFFSAFSLLFLLLLHRNFICWRIFHRLARWQQLARRNRSCTRVWELNLWRAKINRS